LTKHSSILCNDMKKKIILRVLCQPMKQKASPCVWTSDNGLIRDILSIVIDGTRSFGISYSPHNNQFWSKNALLTIIFASKHQENTKLSIDRRYFGILTKMMVRKSLFILIILIYKRRTHGSTYLKWARNTWYFVVIKLLPPSLNINIFWVIHSY